MMSQNIQAINAVVIALIIITIVIVFMVYVPYHIGLILEKRRKASKETRRTWLRSHEPREQGRQPGIELGDYPLRYPEPARTRRSQSHPEDWPLRRSEPVVMSERRRQPRFEDVDLGYGTTGGNLEGFPYFIR